MSRQKKSRAKAGRIPAEVSVELERDRHISLSKLKPKQRSQYQKMQDEKLEANKGTAQSKRKSRLKLDPAQVAEQSKQLLEDAQGDAASTEE